MKRGKIHPARALGHAEPGVGTPAAGLLPGVLLGLVLPDPCDEHCPADFRKKVRQLLRKTRNGIGDDDLALRQALLAFLSDFAHWDLSLGVTHLEVARGLVKAAHPEEPPLVVHPFAAVAVLCQRVRAVRRLVGRA